MHKVAVVRFLVACGLLQFQAASWAATFTPSNYFVTNTRGIGKSFACIATEKNNPGTYNRIFQYSAAHCPGVRLYGWTKGAPIQWAEEHFYAEGGYIKLIDDTGDRNGIPLSYAQALRIDATMRKGLPVFVDGPVTDLATIDHPGYWVERWEGNTCPSTHTTSDFMTGYEENKWIGTKTAWLWDCRKGRPCDAPGAPKYAVEVIERNGFMAGGAVDHFWFARWRDPVNGNQWYGLGPVRFSCEGASWCPTPSENHYLVDCDSYGVTCYSCPDP